MKIPEPKARYGDKVVVLNYRNKPPKWVDGECRRVSYEESFSSSGFSWTYNVYVRLGKGYFLAVDDKGLQK